MKRFTLGITLCALSLATTASAALQVAGGRLLGEGHPIARSTVMLYADTKTGQGLCSGVIIAEDMILTAAHCLSGSENVTVVFGTSLEKAEIGISADALLISSRYIDKREFDLGLVRFHGGLPKGFTSAQILEAEHVLDRLDPVILAGFGVTSYKGRQGSGVLRFVQERIHADYFPGEEVLIEHLGKTGICPGDSGGPAYVQSGNDFKVFGITSRLIVSDAPCGSAAIYTDVHEPAVRKYIQRAIQKLRKL